MSFDPRQGPFLRQTGLAHGMTKHQLDGPDFQPVFGSVRVPAHVELTPEVLARCAALIVPTAAISHHSAARLWGAVAPTCGEVHLTVPRHRDRRSRPGLAFHVNPKARLRHHRDLLLTSPGQTFLDMAAVLDLVDQVVLGDSLVRDGALEMHTLHRVVTSAGGPHSKGARAAADLVRVGAESPMETRLRLLLVLAGFAEPLVQHEVVSADGRHRYRFDLAYPEIRVAIEYDGRHHATDGRQWGHDLVRREWLDGHGWRLVVVRSVDIFGHPWRTVWRLRDVLAQHGYDRALPVAAPATFATHFPAQPWRSGQG